MNAVCVFCGSNFGTNPIYREAARTLASYLAQRGITLVYGGGSVGLMGEIANHVLQNGGEVIGVIPKVLHRKEVVHHRLTKLHTVETMHDRKRVMYDLSDAFVTLPGGLGTLDELCEILTWGQLGLHAKPVGIWNVNRFFDGLLAHFESSIKERFMKDAHRELILHSESLEELFEKFKNYKAPSTSKWIKETQV